MQLPQEYVEKMSEMSGPVLSQPQLQELVARNFAKVMGSLEAARARVAENNAREIARFERCVGPVKDFAGVITRV